MRLTCCLRDFVVPCLLFLDWCVLVLVACSFLVVVYCLLLLLVGCCGCFVLVCGIVVLLLMCVCSCVFVSCFLAVVCSVLFDGVVFWCGCMVWLFVVIVVVCCCCVLALMFVVRVKLLSGIVEVGDRSVLFVVFRVLLSCVVVGC